MQCVADDDVFAAASKPWARIALQAVAAPCAPRARSPWRPPGRACAARTRCRRPPWHPPARTCAGSAPRAQRCRCRSRGRCSRSRSAPATARGAAGSRAGSTAATWRSSAPAMLPRSDRARAAGRPATGRSSRRCHTTKRRASRPARRRARRRRARAGADSRRSRARRCRPPPRPHAGRHAARCAAISRSLDRGGNVPGPRCPLTRFALRRAEHAAGYPPRPVRLALHEVEGDQHGRVRRHDLERLHDLPVQHEGVEEARRARAVHRLVAAAHHAHELGRRLELGLDRRRRVGERLDLVVALEGVELLADHLLDRFAIIGAQVRIVLGKAGGAEEPKGKRTAAARLSSAWAGGRVERDAGNATPERLECAAGCPVRGPRASGKPLLLPPRPGPQ